MKNTEFEQIKLTDLESEEIKNKIRNWIGIKSRVVK